MLNLDVVNKQLVGQTTGVLLNIGKEKSKISVTSVK